MDLDSLKREAAIMNSQKKTFITLAAGGLATILAAACCLGPLVLVSIGLSGAWIANLQLLEPYRPIFLGGAFVALFFAWRRIYRPAAACKPSEICALPKTKSVYKVIFWTVAALVFVALVFPYVAPLFY
jgi:mercuric ion transport protein